MPGGHPLEAPRHLEQLVGAGGEGLGLRRGVHVPEDLGDRVQDEEAGGQDGGWGVGGGGGGVGDAGVLGGGRVQLDLEAGLQVGGEEEAYLECCCVSVSECAMVCSHILSHPRIMWDGACREAFNACSAQEHHNRWVSQGMVQN